MTGDHPSVTAYRIGKETQEEINTALDSLNFPAFCEALEPIESNFKSTSLLKKLIVDLDKSIKIKWGKELVFIDNVSHKVCGGIFLHQAQYYKKDPSFVYDIVDKFCDDENWNVRQIAIDLLEQMYAKGEPSSHDFMQKLVSSESVFHRRLALLTAKQIAQSAYYPTELKSKTLELIAPLITETDPYVITISTETFEEGFIKYCSDLTFAWVNDNIEEIDDPTAISAILMMIGSRHVKDHLDDALSILDKYLTSVDPKIKTARSAALHSLARVNHDDVANFLEQRMHIKEAVDHWAELQALGSLDSYNI